MRIFAALVLMVGLAACGDDDVRPDSGSPDAGNDTGAPMDATLADAPAGDAATDTGPAPDAGPGEPGALCPAGACNLVVGACEGAEPQACYLARPAGGGDATGMCAPVGAGAMGSTCDSVNACAPGLSCIGSECRPVCCGGSDADCPSGGLCRGNTDTDGIGFCIFSDDCDLLAQTGCEATEGCYPLSSDGGTSCGTAGTAADGAACDSSNDCMGGSICLEDMICHPLCSDAMPCADPMTCSSLTAFEGVGVCTTPSA